MAVELLGKKAAEVNFPDIGVQESRVGKPVDFNDDIEMRMPVNLHIAGRKLVKLYFIESLLARCHQGTCF